MVEVTKKQRYTQELIRGLLENRAFLNALTDIHTATATLPIIDFKIAVERCKFSAAEEVIMASIYGEHNTDELSVEEWAARLNISRASMYRLLDEVVAKVDAEMNRGLTDVQV